MTGLRPATAISIVNLGIDLTSLTIKSNLQQALESVGLITIETEH
ncbi:hypothetical protein [Alteribacillus sp. YIM 98480]|nr:hypothetical protein [Alteribacillus sp. YIM 98480]